MASFSLGNFMGSSRFALGTVTRTFASHRFAQPTMGGDKTQCVASLLGKPTEWNGLSSIVVCGISRGLPPGGGGQHNPGVQRHTMVRSDRNRAFLLALWK